jgi:hypothetical protein
MKAEEKESQHDGCGIEPKTRFWILKWTKGVCTMTQTRIEMSIATKALLKVIKPSTTKEERTAIASAVKYLGRELSQRHKVFPAELRIEKPPRPNAPTKRSIAVLIVDYDNRRTTEVLVDAQGKAHRKIDLTGFQPAFLADEINEARRIAERDERVANAARVRGAFASAFGPHTYGERVARMVGLRYAAVGKKGDVQLLGEAVVDLSTQKLVSFEDTRREEGH